MAVYEYLMGIEYYVDGCSGDMPGVAQVRGDGFLNIEGSSLYP